MPKCRGKIIGYSECDPNGERIYCLECWEKRGKNISHDITLYGSEDDIDVTLVCGECGKAIN